MKNFIVTFLCFTIFSSCLTTTIPPNQNKYFKFFNTITPLYEIVKDNVNCFDYDYSHASSTNCALLSINFLELVNADYLRIPEPEFGRFGQTELFQRKSKWAVYDQFLSEFTVSKYCFITIHECKA